MDDGILEKYKVEEQERIETNVLRGPYTLKMKNNFVLCNKYFTY